VPPQKTTEFRWFFLFMKFKNNKMDLDSTPSGSHVYRDIDLL